MEAISLNLTLRQSPGKAPFFFAFLSIVSFCSIYLLCNNNKINPMIFSFSFA